VKIKDRNLDSSWLRRCQILHQLAHVLIWVAWRKEHLFSQRRCWRIFNFEVDHHVVVSELVEDVQVGASETSQLQFTSCWLTLRRGCGSLSDTFWSRFWLFLNQPCTAFNILFYILFIIVFGFRCKWLSLLGYRFLGFRLATAYLLRLATLLSSLSITSLLFFIRESLPIVNNGVTFCFLGNWGVSGLVLDCVSVRVLGHLWLDCTNGSHVVNSALYFFQVYACFRFVMMRQCLGFPRNLLRHLMRRYRNRLLNWFMSSLVLRATSLPTFTALPWLACLNILQVFFF